MLHAKMHLVTFKETVKEGKVVRSIGKCKNVFKNNVLRNCIYVALISSFSKTKLSTTP